MNEHPELYDSLVVEIKKAKDANALEELGQRILETEIMQGHDDILVAWSNKWIEFGRDADGDAVTNYLEG